MRGFARENVSNLKDGDGEEEESTAAWSEQFNLAAWFQPLKLYGGV